MIVMEFAADVVGFSLQAEHRELLEGGCLVGFKPEYHLLRFYPPLTIRRRDVDLLLGHLDLILGNINQQ